MRARLVSQKPPSLPAREVTEQTYILNDSTRSRILTALSKLEGVWNVRVSKHVAKRTDSQNRRYWKLVGMAAEVVGCSPEELHEQMLGAFFGWQEVNIGPKRFRVPKERSRVQDTKRFNEYMEWCEQKFIQYCGTWLE